MIENIQHFTNCLWFIYFLPVDYNGVKGENWIENFRISYFKSTHLNCLVIILSWFFVFQKQPLRSVLRIRCCLIEIALRHGCSFVNLLHIFRTRFPRWLLLDLALLNFNREFPKNLYFLYFHIAFPLNIGHKLNI